MTSQFTIWSDHAIVRTEFRMPSTAARIENNFKQIKKKKDQQKKKGRTNKTPDWDTLWKDEELRQDFIAAVNMNEEWNRQVDWLKAAAPTGRTIQRRQIDEHFDKCDDVMNRWAKHFAPRKNQRKQIKQAWYSQECIEAKKVWRILYEDYCDKCKRGTSENTDIEAVNYYWNRYKKYAGNT